MHILCFQEALAQAALDLEALPLLQAQVEVYQSDFNAERLARERIAGEKADLEEQLRKAGIQKHTAMQGGGGGFEGHQARGGGGGSMNQYGHGARGAAFEGPRTNGLDRGGVVRERLNSGAARDQQYDNIPRTVNTRYTYFKLQGTKLGYEFTFAGMYYVYISFFRNWMC